MGCNQAQCPNVPNQMIYIRFRAIARLFCWTAIETRRIWSLINDSARKLRWASGDKAGIVEVSNRCCALQVFRSSLMAVNEYAGASGPAQGAGLYLSLVFLLS